MRSMCTSECIDNSVARQREDMSEAQKDCRSSMVDGSCVLGRFGIVRQAVAVNDGVETRLNTNGGGSYGCSCAVPALDEDGLLDHRRGRIFVTVGVELARPTAIGRRARRRRRFARRRACQMRMWKGKAASGLAGWGCAGARICVRWWCARKHNLPLGAPQ